MQVITKSRPQICSHCCFHMNEIYKMWNCHQVLWNFLKIALTVWVLEKEFNPISPQVIIIILIYKLCGISNSILIDSVFKTNLCPWNNILSKESSI